MFDILLTTLVGIFVVEEFFLLIPKSSHNIALVRIFINGSFTKVMNFAAADENSQINNKRQGGTRGEQKLWGTKLNERRRQKKETYLLLMERAIQG